MAAGDVKRVVRSAPHRITWVYRNNNNSVVNAPSSTVANISKDTAGPAAATNAVTAQSGGDLHYLDLTATEMSADLIEVLATASGANGVYMVVRPEPALDSGLAAAATSTSLTLASTAAATADLYNGAQLEIVRGTGAGQIRTITDYSSGRVATIDRAWINQPDTTSVYLIHPRTGTPLSTGIKTSASVAEINGDATAAANMEKLYEGAFVTSAVDDASPTSSSFIGAAGLSATDDFYNDMLIVFTSGTLKGIPRRVSDYVGSTRTFTTGAYPTAPANGDTFIIIALVV